MPNDNDLKQNKRNHCHRFLPLKKKCHYSVVSLVLNDCLLHIFPYIQHSMASVFVSFPLWNEVPDAVNLQTGNIFVD